MSKSKSESITFRPMVLLRADDVVEMVADGGTQEFIFAVIVGLERACADAEFLERVHAHFAQELQRETESQSNPTKQGEHA